jgi:hypothetical protein
LWVRARRDFHPERFAAAVAETPRLRHLYAHVPPDRRADARRVIADVVRIADCSVELKLYALLRVWLALHISATALLLTLLFAHVGAVLLWFV